MDYLTLPFTLRDAFINRGDLHESLSHAVGLVLSTRIGRMPFMPEFGSEIWNREYADIFSANKADVRSALRNAIDRFEKRLYNLSVSFTPSDQYSAQRLGMKVRVTGNYKEDGEEKKFESTYQLM